MPHDSRRLGRDRGRDREQSRLDASPFPVVAVGVTVLVCVGLLGGVALVVTALATGHLSLNAKATPTTAAAAPRVYPFVPPAPPVNSPAPPVNRPTPPQPDLLAPRPVGPPPAAPLKPTPNPRTPAEDGYYTQEKERDYAAKNEMFIARMPAGEKSRDFQKVIHLDRHAIWLEGAEVESGTNTYTAATLGIPVVLLVDTPASERPEMICEALYKSRGGKIGGKKEVKLENAVGKEFLVEMSDSAARVQVYTAAGYVLLCIVEGKDLTAVRASDADAFLAGVKLTDESRKRFRDLQRR